MKTKDFLIVTLAPLPVLLIPLIGNLASPSNWKWTASDFVIAYVIFALTALAFRLLLTRKWSNLAYKLGAGLGVLTGFLMTWITLAVQIIGDESPANLLYPVTVLLGAIGIALSRFQPAGMARTAFTMAGIILLIPVVAFAFWPDNFAPGMPQVFALNFGFVAMFVVSGLLFRFAARQSSPRDTAAIV